MLDFTPEDIRGSVEGAVFDRSYSNRTLTLFVLLAGAIVYIEAMLIPSLPTIGAQYGVTIAEASLTVSLSMVFGVALIPLVGKLGDIYGKKRVLNYVLLVYLITVAGTAFAPDFPLLLVARTVQGIGLAVFPLAFSLVREQFPRELVPRGEGMIGAMEGGGISVGLVLGALVTTSFGWQANFRLVLPILVVLVILAYFLVKESGNSRSSSRVDYGGALWLGAAVGAVVLGLSEGASWGWTSPPTLGLVLGGLSSLIPLALYEARRTDPVLDWALLRSRNVAIANAMSLVSGVGMYAGFLLVTYRLELPSPSGFGFDPYLTGLYLLPLSITILLVAFPVGVLIPRFGVRPFLLIGPALGSLGFLLVSSATSAFELASYLILASAGLAMMFVANSNLLVLSVEKRDMGLATSLNTLFSTVGTSAGAPIVAAILSTFVESYSTGSQTLVLPSEMAFRLAFYGTILGLLAAGLLAVLAREVMGRGSEGEYAGESNGALVDRL